MLKKFFKDLIFVFIAVATFSTSMITTSLALVDIPTEQNYSVIQDYDGANKFESSMPSLRILPWFDSNSGDLSVEFGNPFCLAYAGLYVVAMGGNSSIKASATLALIAAAATIYGIAYDQYEDLEICGADWLVWGSEDSGGPSALSNIRNHYPVLGAFNGSKKHNVVQCNKNFNLCVQKCNDRAECDPTYQDELTEAGSDDNKKQEAENKHTACLNNNICIIDLDFIVKEGPRTYLTINDKVFRERLYDGEEIENRDCFDPREEAKHYDVNQARVAIGKVPYQRYYMRGYAQGNYACNRFLVERVRDGDEFDEAYNCCIKTSKSVCIKNKNDIMGKFCSIDNQYCTMGAIIFKIFKSKLGDSKQYCARTWSLCPFNFNIQKGSEQTLAFKKTFKNVQSKTVIEDECYDNTTDTALQCQGKIKNFYQYNRHCTIISEWLPMPEDENSYPPFIDKACMNFVGSSHNTIDYAEYKGYEKMFDMYKSFTAPVAECITETLKNFLFNRAGHTKCKLSDDNLNLKPDIDGKCPDNNVEYTEGDNLANKNINSPASRLLSYIRNLIMLAVTLMITLYGYNILINSGKMDRKSIIIMMLKVVIVISFSASDWWYDQLFRFTYGFSNTLSSITAKIGFDDTIDRKGNYIKYDGCYFGDIYNMLGKSFDDAPEIEHNNYYLYPANRKYIAFFDSLDCKITRYFGYGIGKNVPSLLVFLGASLIWPFNIGIYLGVATFMLALFVISFAIKAVYIFVAASIGIAIMLYVSPIIIPCILFAKTKGIFDKWLKNLISFCLQPMIMFAFVAMSLTIMDKYTLGEGIYSGQGISKELICGYACVDEATNGVISYTADRSGGSTTTFNANCGADNNILDIKRESVLCFLDSMTTTPWAALQSFGLFLPVIIDIFLSDVIMFLRVAFLFFILTKVLGTVPGIASNLTGGRDLPGTKHGDPIAGANKLWNFLGTVTRGVSSTGKTLAEQLKKGRKKSEVGNDEGNKDEDSDSGDKRDTPSNSGSDSTSKDKESNNKVNI